LRVNVSAEDAEMPVARSGFFIILH